MRFLKPTLNILSLALLIAGIAGWADRAARGRPSAAIADTSATLARSPAQSRDAEAPLQIEPIPDATRVDEPAAH